MWLVTNFLVFLYTLFLLYSWSEPWQNWTSITTWLIHLKINNWVLNPNILFLLNSQPYDLLTIFKKGGWEGTNRLHKPKMFNPSIGCDIWVTNIIFLSDAIITSGQCKPKLALLAWDDGNGQLKCSIFTNSSKNHCYQSTAVVLHMFLVSGSHTSINYQYEWGFSNST